jgi:hypothetical protein
MGWCQLHMNILFLKTVLLHKSPKTLNCDFVENRSKDFDYSAIRCGGYFSKQKYIFDNLRKLTVGAAGAQTYIWKSVCHVFTQIPH